MCSASIEPAPAAEVLEMTDLKRPESAESSHVFDHKEFGGLLGSSLFAKSINN